MTEELVFEKKGFPSIRIYQDHFKIKSIDYWDYRTFYYSDIKDIIHYDPNDNIWSKIFRCGSHMSFLAFHKSDPWVLKIIKVNGGDWKYKTSYKFNHEFRKAIKEIKTRLSE